jgi:hypothetical protein
MTLTEAAFWTKKVGVVVAVLASIFVILAIILTSINQQNLPPEYLTANYACTETKEEFLENKLEIPSLEVNSDSENIFELQTDTGKVDTLSNLDIINIYKYKEKIQQLDSQLQAKEIASALGFNPDNIHRVGTTGYVWNNSVNKRSLEITARTLNFTMTTQSSYVRDVSKENPIPSENEAIALAKNTIRSLGILGSDYNYNEPGNISTHLIDVNPDGTYSEAASLAEAELIKVDLHKTKPMISIKESVTNSEAIINSLNNDIGQAEEDEIIVNDQRVKVYNYSALITYQDPNSSNISVYVGPEDPNNEDKSNIYRIEFAYWQLEQESCGTYELVSPTYALEKVQNGEGSLVYLNEKNGDEIEEYQPRTVKKYVIYDIDLAYYEPINEPMFLQPIYIITGESIFKDDTRGEFHIFYPAINYEIVQDKQESPQEPTEQENSNGMFGL